MKLDKTFLIGADSTYEDLLPWCVNNIRKHNPDIAISVADFGLSSSMKTWSNKNVEWVIEYEKHQVNPWFYKPQAILNSPFDYTCWIDIDCEVCDNIEEIFEYCSDEKIGLTEDPCRRKEKPGEEWIATGVVATKGKPFLLKFWAEQCNTTRLRGDQEVLHDILNKNNRFKDLIIKMPMEYQWLRLMKEDNPKKKIMHWTGPKGKEYIRSLINNQR